MNEHSADEVPHGDFPGIVPVLEDSTARLRAMTAADLPFVVEMCGDAESARWTTVPQPYGLADARSFLEEHGGFGLRRLVAETAADNTASNRALASAGFTEWGREAAADAPDGSVGPAVHWERLA